MIICHKHKFIFIHIGKTGGTSIERALCRHLSMDFDTTKKSPEGTWWKHIWATDMRRRVGPDLWDNYFTFAFVRNPYDMILSLYSMYTQYPEYTSPALYRRLFHPWNQYTDFAHFIHGVGRREHEPDEQWRIQLEELGVTNQMEVWDSLQNLQTSYLTDSWKGTRGLGTVLVDFIGRYEQLERDFALVCRTVGLPQLRLERHGRSQHRPFHEVYDGTMQQIVYRHFKMDIERFGYELQGSA
jgi:sulfotransferase famil protein